MKTNQFRLLWINIIWVWLALTVSPLFANQPGNELPEYIGVVTDIDDNGAFHLQHVDADFYLIGWVFTEFFVSSGGTELVGKRIHCREMYGFLDDRDGVTVGCHFVYGEQHGRDIHEYLREIEVINLYCEPYDVRSKFYLDNC